MHEVIIYRNPFEAMFWHFIMSATFFALFVGVVVFFVVLLGADHVLWTQLKLRNSQRTKFSMSLAILAGVGVAWWLLRGI